MRRTVCVCALFMLVAGKVLAQSPNATVTGEVVDPSGAAIADVTVEVINEATNVKYSTKTNREGIYVIPELAPATYRIEVSHVGFKTVLKPDVIFNVRDVVAINFKLPVGALSETVTVEGGAPMVNTTDASVSTVVDQTYVKNMPLNGRSFQDLILLAPGVVTSPSNGGRGLGQTGEFSVNGQRSESNYYTVDGVSANVGAAPGPSMAGGAGPSGSVPAATVLGTTQALVSVDALQEFRVQSSTYSAEYGRNPGGQFAFQTKSGTNQWHGTAYDYLRNDFFDAADYFIDYLRPLNPALTKPATRQNDFGGTLGGPIRIPRLYNGKDKTFFFVSYEGLRLIQPQSASDTIVPDATLRSSAPAPLNQALNAFPVPNGPEVLVSCDPATDSTCPSSGQKQDGLAHYIASWSNPASINSTSVRFDRLVNDKLRLFFRFNDTSSSSATRGGGAVTMNNPSASTLRTYTAGASSLFTDRLSNEFHLNFSSNEATIRQVIDQFGGNTPVNLTQLAGLSPEAQPVLLFVYDGNGIQLSQFSSSASAQKQWNLVDSVSLFLGRHQLKFGADYRRLAPFQTPFTPVAVYYYPSEAEVEANSAFTLATANAPAYPLYMNSSAFAQDDWRVSQHLSLSLGLRWEVNPAPGVTQGIKPYTVQGSSADTWALAPPGTALWQTTWYNFAPRLGAAYILHNAPGRETVVRGGGGVFFDTGQQLGSQGINTGPGFSANSNIQQGSFPGSLAAQVPAIVNPPMAPYNNTTPYGFASHLQLPYTLQWNASIEQALGASQALTISYVGSHAARLLKEVQISAPSNPNATFFNFIENGLTADYDSLQLQFRRRLSRGLTALISYAWSHCIDYGSNNFTFGYQRGNCDFDVRHNLSAAFSYDLPNVGHNGFVKSVLYHWGFDDRFTIRTAFPVTLVGNLLLQPNGQFYDGGLSFVPGQPVYLYGANCTSVLQGQGDLQPGQGCPGGRAINPNAFTAVDSGFGDTPRNFATGFGAWQMNLAVRRDFPVHERLKLQFRAEAFNVFNHPNFGSINANCGGTPGTPGCTNPQFGQANATLASSLGVLNPLYQQGGPRSMQFALKMIF